MGRANLESAELPWGLRNMGAGRVFNEQEWNQSMAPHPRLPRVLHGSGVPFLALPCSFHPQDNYIFPGLEQAMLLNEGMESAYLRAQQ